MIDTDDLISGLANEGAKPVENMTRKFVLPLVLAVLFCATVLLLIFGEPFKTVAIYGPGPMIVKWGFSLPLMIGGGFALFTLGKPAAALRWWITVLVLPFAAFLVLLGLYVANPSGSFPGQTWGQCLIAMATLGPLSFVSAIVATRFMAPTNLRLAGFVAGLFGGGVAMSAYAPFCPELGMMYMGTFYVLPITIMAAVGWFLGPKLLRW